MNLVSFYSVFVLLFSLARKKSSGVDSAATIRTKVFVWGLNDKDQLGGLKGSKVWIKAYLTLNEFIVCIIFIPG